MHPIRAHRHELHRALRNLPNRLPVVVEPDRRLVVDLAQEFQQVSLREELVALRELVLQRPGVLSHRYFLPVQLPPGGQGWCGSEVMEVSVAVGGSAWITPLMSR